MGVYFIRLGGKCYAESENPIIPDIKLANSAFDRWGIVHLLYSGGCYFNGFTQKHWKLEPLTISNDDGPLSTFAVMAMRIHPAELDCTASFCANGSRLFFRFEMANEPHIM